VWLVDPGGECEALVNHNALPPIARYRRPEAAVVSGDRVYVSDSATDSVYVFVHPDYKGRRPTR